MATNPIVQEIKRQGARLPASVRRRYVAAALETGRVESGFTNPSGGDADSAGWRQERASLYANPTNVQASVARFFQEAAKWDRGQPSYQLAADVQRPAAQYRGRYKGAQQEALGLLGSGGGTSPAAGSVTTTQTTPGVDNSQARRALVANFLAQGGVKSATAVGALASGYQAAQDVPGTTTTTTTAQPGTAPARTAQGGGTVARVKARADAINAQHLPYSWGGGHAGKTSIHEAVPLDCSGAVSKALGIDPRVSGQFETWGKAGDGGSHGVTVAANGHHVLMKIDGHWFGTSASNPGGGAGWIKQEDISPQYLQGFTLRHL